MLAKFACRWAAAWSAAAEEKKAHTVGRRLWIPLVNAGVATNCVWALPFQVGIGSISASQAQGRVT